MWPYQIETALSEDNSTKGIPKIFEPMAVT